ncbi:MULTISPECIES: hypothetical protein [Amycolatopsis]|uniref:Secreted protein n=1 Tax=Amycolatopsis thermalba TaxID=944492 RepID=A0ABY4NT00_9PSEU|nr:MULTISPECIES: hypothetical protein [Amycolatopsis]UQS23171.1 hypothetical protein L1857_10255 [Amycolatopsis thermalba]
MRKPLGRLAAAVISGALISLTMAPAALAEESTTPEVTTTTSAAPESTETSAPSSAAETTSETSSAATATSQPSLTSSPATTSTTTSPGTTESSQPTSTSESSTPEEPPYQDDVAYGIDLGDGTGVLIIACAAGQPTDVWSPDFDILDGPYQEEQDGRYWDYLVQLHEGKSFDAGNVTADWTCAGAPQGGGSSGGGVAPVPGSGEADEWQQSNGGDAQVSFAPKQGVETGAGGTARF